MTAQKANFVHLNIPFKSKLPFSFTYERRVFQQDIFTLNANIGFGGASYKNVAETRIIPQNEKVNVWTGEVFTSILLTAALGGFDNKEERIETISLSRLTVGSSILLGNKNYSLELGMGLGVDMIKRSELNEIKSTTSSSDFTKYSALPSVAFRHQSSKGFTYNLGVRWSKSYEEKGGYVPYLLVGFGFGF
jgi:hypothetical protein